jgi:serine/threonine protein kinase
MPTATAAEPVKAPAETPHVARIISSDSIPVGGFTPGTILADRYRIIGLLGRGGMGEVYRADDLKLGQPVALKFLPPKLAEDPVRRERFFAEVRITRQLSHPNICPVYDIAEIDGRHFLSMEFIDGEDLASLLRRIGYLSNEKALDIARQLAAGLAAAHERGVLHRDLKPANIMLDGHGRVRITDFGLAIAQGDETQAAEIAGTPAYMAPEQLAGKGATVRSDMYSLGLVLYEIYTGKKAFTAATLAELREQKETHTPRAISEIREGIDSVVERLIRRCMEKDPNARPASVAQLALALPGGDPLAAALAAGETPSPEMVAASGSKEGLRPPVAWGLLAFIVVAITIIVLINNHAFLHRRTPFEKSPDALVEISRQLIKKAGYPGDYKDSAHGFAAEGEVSNGYLDAKRISFWCRQSPQSLQYPVGGLSANNPPLQVPGEILVVLDTKGRLISFHAVPLRKPSFTGATAPPDWSVFFIEGGLEFSQWTESRVQFVPPFFADNRQVWESSVSDVTGAPVRIEAASFEGKPISFEVIQRRNQYEKMEPFEPRTSRIIPTLAFSLFYIIIIGGGIFLARKNLHHGRGDRRGAARLSMVILISSLLAWILAAPYRSILALPLFPCLAGLSWIVYIAIEPFVRRRWPQALVSWTRLLAGDWRDPLVARDVFVGCALGVLVFILARTGTYFLPLWITGKPFVAGNSIELESVLGPRFFVSEFLNIFLTGTFVYMGIITIISLLRILVRNQKVAIAISILLVSLVSGGPNHWMLGTNLVVWSLGFFVLMRFGLVAAATGYLIAISFQNFPTDLNPSAWYAGYSYAALLIIAAIVLYGFYASLGGQPMLGRASLED